MGKVNPMDYYREMLENIILNYDNSEKNSSYIEAFSLFLSSGNPSYKYNVAYLRRENNKFLSFIFLAKEKVDKIKKVRDNIKKHFKDSDNIKILMDNFLIIGLLDDQPKIYEKFDISMAKTPISNSFITVFYDKDKSKSLTFTHLDDIEKIKDIVNKIGWKM